MTDSFVASVHVRWSDIDMYQHINHATMVTLLEEARIPSVDFTIGYEVRALGAPLDSKPSVIAETQLAAVHIKEQRLQRLSPAQRDYLQHWTR
ncbi:MAG: hypothetical protein JF631_13460 [Mycobacterium sp.]|nr:hypothetical protein [Mycobacterium sp.]